MTKKLSIFALALSVLFCWCTKVNEEINYHEATGITWYEYSKLSYLLEWVIDVENDKADIRNKPLASDHQKWRFIFNILNNNYMDKYENPMEASDYPVYPILDETLYVNWWDIHDWVVINNQDFKVGYKRSDLNKILEDSVWESVNNWGDLNVDWLILSWDNYLLFNYKYYWSDLIGNKWRATSFEIDSISQASDKDIEVTASYFDDFLQEKENYDIGECNLTYHISKNPWSFYWYTVNEYKYTWCSINTWYLAPDMPSQIIYWLKDWIYNDYIWLKKEFRSEEINIDLNNDWIDEFFRIWVNSPNWSQILWVNWDKWYNFILDFTNNIVDEDNTLRDWLFVDIYFENIDWWDELETIVSIWDKKTWSESNIYKLWWEDGFTRIGTIYWDSYLLYESSSKAFHAPYSKSWKCAEYHIVDWRIWEVVE